MLTQSQSNRIAKPDCLMAMLERAAPGYTCALVWIHSPTALTTVLMQDCGARVRCRWSFGLSGMWTMIPLY